MDTETGKNHRIVFTMINLTLSYFHNFFGIMWIVKDLTSFYSLKKTLTLAITLKKYWMPDFKCLYHGKKLSCLLQVTIQMETACH